MKNWFLVGVGIFFTLAFLTNNVVFLSTGFATAGFICILFGLWQK